MLAQGPLQSQQSHKVDKTPSRAHIPRSLLSFSALSRTLGGFTGYTDSSAQTRQPPNLCRPYSANAPHQLLVSSNWISSCLLSFSKVTGAFVFHFPFKPRVPLSLCSHYLSTLSLTPKQFFILQGHPQAPRLPPEAIFTFSAPTAL